MTFLKALISFSLVIGTVLAQGQAVADFSSDTTSGCAPLTISFQNQSSSNAKTFRWSFGNGNLSSKENPQAIFYQPGTYEISLEVADSTGAKDEEKKTAYITVFKNPTADFSRSVSAGCAPLFATLLDKSKEGDAPIAEYLWDFGDGNTTKTKSPNHLYVTQGKFTVSLLVIDGNKCESQLDKRNFIEIQKVLDVDFEADKTFDCDAPFTVNFQDKTPRTSSGDTYKWDFGDGSTSTAKNPSHTYTTKGIYSVNLEITTSDGCKSQLKIIDYINVGRLEANFSADETQVCAPAEVKFKNTTRPAGLTTTWDLGDLTVKSGYNVNHTYTTSGTYSVTMTVESTEGCKASETKVGYISVIDMPKADFTMNDTQSCKKPFTFNAQNTSTNYLEADWYFQSKIDSFSSTSFFRNITEYGTYGVTLTVKNQYNCVDNKSIDIKVLPLDIKLSADKKGGCINLDVEYTDKTEYIWPVSTKLWTFGDGNTSTSSGDNVQHTYKDTGRYKAILTITNNIGCVGSDTVPMLVGMKTNPTFSINKDTFCNNEEVLVEVTSNLLTPFVDTLWIGNDIVDTLALVYTDKEGEGFLPQSRYEYSDKGQLKDNPEFGKWTKNLKSPKGWRPISVVTSHNRCRDTITQDSAYYIDPPYVVLLSEGFDPCRDLLAEIKTAEVCADSLWYVVRSTKKDTSYTLLGYQESITIDRSQFGNASVTVYATNDSTVCEDYSTESVQFYSIYTPDFDINGDLCAPANLNFTRKLDLNNIYDKGLKNEVIERSRLEYNWTIDSFLHSDKDEVFQQFVDPGKKEAKLVVVDKTTRCKDSLEKSIVITGPIVEGSIASSGVCLPIPLSLTSSVNSADFDTLYWLIEGRKVFINGSGTISDTLYSAVGSDTNDIAEVQLIAIDSNGCVGSKSFYVPVNGPKDAKIDLSRFGNCNGQRFIFSAEPRGPFDYFWEFGNGDTSSARVKQVYYTSADVYNVNLYITDQEGCRSKITQTIDIDKERVNAAFDADSLQNDCPPLFVQFKNKSTSIGRKIRDYFWDFGDGSTSIEENPSKLYLRAGKFTVKLFVIDEWGCSDSIIYPDFVIVNGPEGSYTFDKKLGCVPLTVNFTSSTKRADFYEWDMGDGTVIENTATVTHIYDQPGRFIPLLILKDTFGCDYTLPPIDTIYVDPYPDPDFDDNATCVNVPITMKARNENELRVEEYIWELYTSSGIDTLYGEEITYTFIDQKYPTVKLTIVSKNGCSNSITRNLKLISLDGAVSTENNATCVGTWIQLRNTSNSDTTLSNIKWIIGGREYTEDEPRFFATEIGPVDITLIQENVLGCRDTLRTNAVVIGDSIRPKDIDILRVSVVDDNSILLDHSRADIVDFKEYRMYLEEPWGYQLVGTQGDQDVTRFTLGNTRTLDESRCLKIEVSNTCGLMSDTLVHNKHCTIETKAQGDTNANRVTWSDYIGWDDVAQYHIYRSEVDQIGMPQRIATVPGDSLAYIDSLLYCNTTYSYRIEGEEQGGNLQRSNSDTAHATPIWFYTPPPNELVRATVDDDIEITIEWDSTRGSIIPIASYILEKSRNGIQYSFLSKEDRSTYSYIDEEVKVDLRSYFYRTYAIDECDDTSGFLNFGKTILLKADTSADQRPLLNWTHYQGWIEDIDYYAVEIKNTDGSFTELAQFPFKDTTYVDMLTDLNQRPDYCYRVVAYKSQRTGEKQVISISNEDCSPVRSKIFYPNAFTPNGDNLNDQYRTPSQYIKEYHAQIYNRWGEMVFESYDLTQNWDGTYKGKDAQMDAYAVIVITTGVDNIRRVHHGTITLVR